MNALFDNPKVVHDFALASGDAKHIAFKSGDLNEPVHFSTSGVEGFQYFHLMTTPKLVTNTIDINAPIDQVWDALVNPEKTMIYMFGCRTESDWKPGSPLLWKGEYEGNPMVFVKGNILEIDAPHHLKYSVFDPNSTMEDIPVNHLKVTYDLKEHDGMTELTVIQDGFETAARGEERYKEVYNNGEGWNPILISIKNLLES